MSSELVHPGDIKFDAVRTSENTYKFLADNNISIDSIITRHISGDGRRHDKGNPFSVYDLAGKRIIVDSYGSDYEFTTILLSSDWDDIGVVVENLSHFTERS
jgi:hypothetical protein